MNNAFYADAPLWALDYIDTGDCQWLLNIKGKNLVCHELLCLSRGLLSEDHWTLEFQSRGKKRQGSLFVFVARKALVKKEHNG